MAKASKATKKFQNKHLKHTIEHRREVQKHAKKYGTKKSKSKSGDDEKPAKPASKATKEVFQDMSVEDFFTGGFEVPKSKKSSKEEEEEDDEEEAESDDAEEDSDSDSEAGTESSEDEDEETLKENMEKLQENDPEFYNYLKNNDKDLLDFQGVNPLDAMSEDESEEEEEQEEEKPKKVVKEVESKLKIEINIALVKKWDQSMKKPTHKLIKNVSTAFKAAVNVSKSAEEDYKYMITDPKAFNELMFLALQGIPEAVQKLAPYKVNAHTGVRSVPTKNENSRHISSILKSQAGSYVTLLKDITNTETAALVLASIQEVLPFYLSFRRLLKEILASVVQVWSTTSDVETQIATFAFLNNACKEFPKSVLQPTLKLVYSSFLKNCRKTNVHTMPMINFCKNSAAELFGIDEALSYQIGFEYIRQLAIHLRNSISATSKSKEGYKAIYNWQYCHSLDFWSRVLSQHCNPDKELENHKSKESPLRQLIYPLVQVTLGAIKLIPTAQFFPLRFYLIRSLIRLSQATGTFIPIFPLISEVLTSTAITRSPKRTTLLPVDFDHNIKVNQQYLGTKTYQDGLCEQFLELTSDFFVLYCKNIAFPELITPAVLSLRRFVKKSKNIRFNKSLNQLIEKLNSNANLILSKRANVEYGPSNKTEVQLFLNDLKWEKTPLGQYVVVQRQAKEEKQRLFRESLAEEEKAKAEKKAREAKEDQDEDQDIDIADLKDDDSEEDEE